MDRRDLLKALAPMAAVVMTPLVVRGKEVGKAVELDPKAKYLVFVNFQAVDACAIVEDPHCTLPEGTPIYPVHVPRDVSLADCIHIYKLI